MAVKKGVASSRTGSVADLVLLDAAPDCAGHCTGCLALRQLSTTDWLDTADSQRLLRYQRHTLDDCVRDMQLALAYRRPLIRVFSPIVRSLLLKQSPYYRAGRSSWVTAAIHGMKALKRRPAHIRIGWARRGRRDEPPAISDSTSATLSRTSQCYPCVCCDGSQSRPRRVVASQQSRQPDLALQDGSVYNGRQPAVGTPFPWFLASGGQRHPCETVS